jgi:hypothetical protein
MISQFSVGVSRTINLGNFESLRVEATIRVEVSEDGDLEQLKLDAQTQLRRLLEETYMAQHEGRKKKQIA